MDRFTEKQLEIDAKKAIVRQNYPSLWQGMISNWARPDNNDRAWLLYSANYLFHTSGVRWAMDPLTLHQRVLTAPDVDVSALAALDYVVLTHRHADHLDLALLRRLLSFPARWIVPEFLLDSLLTLKPPSEKLIIPQPQVPLHLGKLTLIPFDGSHWEAAPGYPNGQRGVPSMSYLAEFSGKRWFLPGDTRTYNTKQQPELGILDGLFAHVWLGRGSALQDKLPLMDQFCQFIVNLSPKRVILSHLYEFGRRADEVWDYSHSSLVLNQLRESDPQIDVAAAQMGDDLLL